jgi:hypothetical protein
MLEYRGFLVQFSACANVFFFAVSAEALGVLSMGVKQLRGKLTTHLYLLDWLRKSAWSYTTFFLVCFHDLLYKYSILWSS